jgi:hypothetical protein
MSSHIVGNLFKKLKALSFNLLAINLSFQAQLLAAISSPNDGNSIYRSTNLCTLVPGMQQSTLLFNKFVFNKIFEMLSRNVGNMPYKGYSIQ